MLIFCNRVRQVSLFVHELPRLKLNFSRLQNVCPATWYLSIDATIGLECKPTRLRVHIGFTLSNREQRERQEQRLYHIDCTLKMLRRSRQLGNISSDVDVLDYTSDHAL